MENINENNNVESNVNTNVLKAIRLKCLDCCCDSANEVKLCPCEKCPLHPFRFGKNPYRTKREYTEEQLEKMRESMNKARQSKSRNTSNPQPSV